MIFRDSRRSTKETFNVIVDKLDLIKDLQSMIAEIPQLVQLVVNRVYSAAIKEAAKAKRQEDSKWVIGSVSSVPRHVSVTGSFEGASINATLDIDLQS